MAKFTAYQVNNWKHIKQYEYNKDADCFGNIKPAKIPVRPNDYKQDSLLTRIKLAYYVFIGKYDALEWRDDPNNAINDSDVNKLKDRR